MNVPSKVNSIMDGCTLIDASAGSGKTHNITTIFRDLILQKKVDVSQILVVTFTEAATGELKDRIRRRLKEDYEKESGENMKLLKKAILSIDEAAIFTIHGFCRKILMEHAFESGCLYGTELATDIEDLLNETYYDYLRNNFLDYDAELLTFIKSTDYSPFSYKKIRRVIQEKLSNPDLIVETQMMSLGDIQKKVALFLTMYASLKAVWENRSGDIEKILRSAALNRNSYKDFDKLFAGMHGFFAGDAICDILEGLENFLHFRKFTSPVILKARSKASPLGVEDDPFFYLCEEFTRAQEELNNLLAGESLQHLLNLFKWFRKSLGQAKNRLSLLTFDDLILSLRNALKLPAKDSLICSLSKRFKAVLVDEFQDTDPLQYEIFKTLFFDNKDIVSYMIGDPKQSIYAFRGADVFSYINAKKGAMSGALNVGPSLCNNYRSDEGLISAINTLFSRVKNIFIIPEIEYEKSSYPPDNAMQRQFSIIDRASKPLEIISITSSNQLDFTKGGFIRKPKAKEYAADFLVREITMLLSNARIDGEVIRRSDIAVLVPTHVEARLIKKKLAEARIPAVYYAIESIFATQECDDLISIMRAVQEPKNENLMKQALLTSFFAVSYEAIVEFEKNPARLESYMEELFLYREKWRKKGFIAMMRAFMSDERVKVQVLALSDGERRMANFSQLVELGQQEAFRRKLDPLGLLKWFEDEWAAAHRKERATIPPQEHLLRLESDEYAVKILTIYKSKGLEFPVVFIPFCWDEVSPGKDNYLKIHEQKGTDYTIKLCLGKAAIDSCMARAEMEELAERMRLLYVAVTRAQHKCYMFWGAINAAAKSAYALLFDFNEAIEEHTVIERMDSTFREHMRDSVERDLRALESSDENIRIRACDDNRGGVLHASATGPAVLKLEARKMPPDDKIERDCRISSFSGLVTGAEKEPYPQDYDTSRVSDKAEGQDAQSAKGFTIFNFPKGSKAGKMFHSILEELDFQEQDETRVRDLVGRILRGYGFDPSPWTDCIVAMLKKVTAAELRNGSAPFTLSQIPLKDRKSELKFLFPVSTCAKEHFTDLLKSLSVPDVQERLDGLSFSPFKGYVNGAIDCVARCGEKYYLFDWKSNYLGGRPDDYGPDKLAKEISSSYYFLQFYLYTIALDQYLASRLGSCYSYESHFGGVYYLFLRGIEPPGESGIYFHRLPYDAVKAFKEKYCARKVVV